MNDLVKKEKEQHPLAAFSDQFNVEPEQMRQTLISTVFRQTGGQPISNEQMVALMIVANEHGLNPFTKEIYAFPDKQNGIIPIIGVDGWLRIINNHSKFRGMEFHYSDNVIKMDDHSKPCPEWLECIMYREDRDHPIVVREYIDEVYRKPFKKNNYVVEGPWQTHTKRQLRTKAIIQAGRIAFGFSGIYEEDEAHRIIEQQEREINPIAPEQPDPNEPSKDQSATESVVTQLKKRKPSEEVTDVNTDDVVEEKQEGKFKPINAKIVSDLKARIDLCESTEQLNKMVSEIAEYNPDTKSIEQVREAWKEKRDSFKKPAE